MTLHRNKKITLVLVVVIVAIQFVQPARNKNAGEMPSDFTVMYVVPENVKTVLQTACYDCHSNNTNYPWYASIQPLGWIMAGHIKNGKAELNFSGFGGYTNRKQITKLKEMANQVKDNAMPLPSYKLLHTNARLSAADKALVVHWLMAQADTLSTNQ